MKKYIEKHQITIFSLFNLIITFITLRLLDTDYIPQWMPGISALFLMGFLYKGQGITNILKQLTLTTQNTKWYIFSFLIPILLSLAVYLIMYFMGNISSFSIKTHYSWQEYSMLFCFIILGSLGEEIGWRGYMLPQLTKKHSFLTSSLIIGFVWGMWHYMLDSGLITFFTYMLFCIETSIVLSWIYYKSNGNLMTSIIYHTSINMSAFIFFNNLFTENNNTLYMIFGTYSLLLLIPCIILGFIKSFHKINA